MRLLFLSSGNRVPSARFRILPYLRFFRSEGHRCTVLNSFPQKYDYFPWMGFRPSQMLKRSVRWWHWLQARLRRFDLVYIDREIYDDPSTEMEQRFREACGRLVIDLDDAVFLRYPEKFDRLMSLADLVVCGNRSLAEHVMPLNERIVEVPTSVDLDVYTARGPTAPQATPVVGWMGTTGNLRYLSVAAKALQTVARERTFELRVVVPEIAPLGAIDLTGVNVVHEPWDPPREVAQLQGMDIGLMPLLAEQDWDRYKCGLKLIQYLAVGIPAIATPVGVNAEILDGNRNGFPARTSDEWVSALRTLLGERERREAMGHRGRETVRRRYSIQTNYPVLRDALRETVERSK